MSAAGLRPLEGKFAIITGGSRGIGAAIAQNLASKGCSLLLNYTSSSSTERTLQLCEELTKAHSIRCISVQADLSEPISAVNKILTSAKNHFTNSSTNSLTIDILINNAGIGGNIRLNDPVRGPINAEFFHRMYTINVLAPLLLTQAVAPYLPLDRSGRIVNLSSVSASLGFEGQSIYGGTKAAIEAMTRTWARELGDRATVNAINPGPVIGDMYWEAGEDFWKTMQGWQDNTPGSKLVVDDGFTGTGAERLSEENQTLVREKMGGRRPAFTDEIAGVVGMLCTKDGQWCTGSVVCANGGLRMSI
ncbi:3-oxoacyl-[acyl-carrier protein] reductase [[Emmonsia] crescens]|uniref:3-oxoacyl-[acyl-carrier protein] reductase n=1 Tax=[Emmonsia] crescens TaxID=73230 RepID=A0A0G2J8Y0_9EURO|nr:3-oxoacyl-[acyl-carrier protein] reductase [Emmonsia crescens UAMH 3008]